jgi:hypothetical protein
MKTSELTGNALNWAVWACEKPDDEFLHQRRKCRPYSTDWSQGGPIIERERIAVGFDGFDDVDSALPVWSACKYVDGFERYGPTPLVAAMRYYVASKLGDEVNVPEGL